MSPTYNGSCLCGEVGFKMNADHLMVACCHCKNCKKYTGTVFSTTVVFPEDALEVTKGKSLISSFNDTAQDSGNALARTFCSRCGSPLYCLGDSGRAIAVFYSALDDFAPGATKDPRPQIEFYSKDRAWWVHPVEGAGQPKTRPEGMTSLNIRQHLSAQD